MPIRIDPSMARSVLAEAVTRAQSSHPVSDAWREWTERVGQATSKTYVAALGTALLGRATDAQIDPMSIKATEGAPAAYSARNLCHGVLVPASREHGFDLGATGREPLNNQPFFRYERMDVMERVRDQAGLRVLLAALREVAKLSQEEARDALSAFVRVRLEVAAAKQRIDLRGVGLGVEQAIDAIATFITEDAEGGKRGQAVVAAVFDLVFDEVRMGRVNDPSRRFPGDVQAIEGVQVALAAEVRQKLVEFDDVIAFARVISDAGVANGVMVALHPEQSTLDRDKLLSACEEEHGVHMAVIDSPAELVSDAFTWAGTRIDEALEELPGLVISRLEEIEVRSESLSRWEALIRGNDDQLVLD